MKKASIYSILCAGLVLSFGCKKFLDKLPDNRVDLTDPKNITVDNISALLVNAYPKANYMGFCESMSDNSSDKGSAQLTTALPNYGTYMYYDMQNNVSQDMPSMYWSEAYKSIAVANQALDAISRATNPQDFAALKGEALIARAYAHFMLVNFFAKTYDPSSATTDPGIPYVTSPETVTFGQYDRKTVASTYDAIRADLLAGLPLINDAAYSVPKYHFTKAAANAFACRYYLFRQQYDSSAIFASKVFGSTSPTANMRPWLTSYRQDTYNQLLQMYSSSNEKANLLIVETVSNWWNYYSYRFGITSALQDTIFGKTNNKLPFWSPLLNGYWAYRMAGQSDYYLNLAKFYPHFVQTGVNSNTGLYYTNIALFTVEEALLNRAEAYAYTKNYTGALADLNTFASQRIYNGIGNDTASTMIPYDPVKNNITLDSLNKYYQKNDPTQNLVSAVLDFKRAEFCFEGMRWFDILRYKIPVTHKYITGQVSDTTIVLTPTDKRRLLQLPDAATLSGLPLNPRD